MNISQPVIEIIKRIDEDYPTISLRRDYDPRWWIVKIFKNQLSEEYREIEIYQDLFYGFISKVYWMNDKENKAVALAVEHKIQRDKENNCLKQRQEFIDWLEIENEN